MAFTLKAEASVPLHQPPPWENGHSWVHLRMVFKLVIDMRRVVEDTMQLGIFLGLGKAGNKFQKGWSSLGKQPPESFGQHSFND